MKITFIERPKGSGSWRLRIETGKDEKGTRLFRYETIRGTEDDAARRRFELLNQNDSGTFAEPSKVTLAAYFRQWVEGRLALKIVERSTAENYLTVFNTHVASALGGMRLQKIRGNDVQALYTKLANAGDLSLSSIRHIHRILAAAFHAARKTRLVVSNPMEEVEPPRVVKPKPKAIQGDKLATLLDAIPGQWFEVPVIIGLGAGLRRGEVLGLRRGDVNLSTGKLEVNGQVIRYDDGSIEWKKPKTEAGVRKLTMPAEVVEALSRYIRTATERRMNLGLGAWKDEDLIFTTDGVSPVSPNRLSADFTAFCAGIGLHDFTFHGTRHTHATALLKQVGRAGAKAVSERIGHADLMVTLGIYQTVFAEDDVELGAMSSGLFDRVQKVPGGTKRGG